MRFHRIIYVYLLILMALLFSVFSSSGLEAQESGTIQDLKLPELDENSSLQDYLSYAALNNPGLESSFNRWKAALERVPQVKAYPDPRFNYAYFIREVETKVGPQQQKFGLSQTFPWFGKLGLKEDMALEAANVEKARYDAAKLKLFFQVKEAYFEYYYLGKSISITNDHFELMKSLERVVRSRYSTGLASNSDLIKSQVELGKLEDRLITLRDLEKPFVARLNASLGRKHDALSSWPNSIMFDRVRFEDDELVSWLKANNPDLLAIEAMAIAEKFRKDLADKNYYPDITLGVEYIDTEEAQMPNVDDSGKDPVIVMASINLPVWRKKYQAAENEADFLYNAAQSQKSDKENLLISRLEMTLFKFRDSGRKIELYRDSLVPKARQALDVSQRAFSTGIASFLDVIDAQRTLLNFELESERALADRAVWLAQIEMLVGRDVPRLGNDTNE
jgi:outer membrane protein, heavy metal efflux system